MQTNTTTPVTFCFRQITADAGLWVSIPHEAPAGYKGEQIMRQGVIGGHYGEPRCVVADTGFFYGLNCNKEMTRNEAIEMGLIEP